ncbi:CmcJ/NvfI family oxidoreductase [Lysobacter sp. CA199]|uniref:CmcJ/NvfI family oxidoreductase n=1 Tax=Lysobacter sp. CA199 TaxID=3455608 RepID=UPI003F8D1BB7
MRQSHSRQECEEPKMSFEPACVRGQSPTESFMRKRASGPIPAMVRPTGDRMNAHSEPSVRSADVAIHPADEPAPVVAGLSYLKPGSPRPCSYAYEPPPGTPWESGEFEHRLVSIADARGIRDSLSVDVEGFRLMDAPTAIRDFLNGDVVKDVYYREAAELAIAATGATRAHVFDHLVRRRERDRAALSFGRREGNGLAAANGRIHNDYSEASGRRRLGLVLGKAQADALTARYAIVNIWRSIKGPVLDTPLAVCDARTLTASDLIASEVRYPRRTGEIYHVAYSHRHRWSYFSRMDRHEAMVFKQYDSQVSGVARLVPHAAFDLPDIPSDAPVRESIELRCLVVYE